MKKSDPQTTTWRPIAEAPTDKTFIIVAARGQMPIVTCGDVLKAAQQRSAPSHLSMRWATHFMILDPLPED